MGYTYDFKNNELYSAEDVNSIRASIISAGVLGAASSAMHVTVSDNIVFVSAGTAVFADGSSLTVDECGVELEYTAGVINYVYLFNDTLLNKNTVNISTTAPVGDYVMLAEINANGLAIDKRTYSAAKYSLLGTKRCLVKFTVPGSTNGWDGSEYVFLGTLNVDRNLRAVTLQNKNDYNIYRQETVFIYDTDVVLRPRNSNTSLEIVDIKITPDFDIWEKKKSDYTVTLIFENMLEGSIEYA